MAYPVVQFDSSSGSDSLASGAGPATAVNSTTEGTTAATDGAGTLVTFSGATDLSGVATDGSHCIYLVDATAGANNFGRITAVDDGADTVTVDTAFGLSLSGLNWAIGGKRQFIGSTNSRKLVENNVSNGDSAAGWVIELMSGYAETLTVALTTRVTGVDTNPFIFRGESGAVTKPVFTISDVTGFFPYGTENRYRDFDIDRTGATDNVGSGMYFYGTSNHVTNVSLTGGSGANRWQYGFHGRYDASGRQCFNCASNHTVGVAFQGGRGLVAIRCLVDNCGADAFSGSPFGGHFMVIDCEVRSAVRGIDFENYGNVLIQGNTLAGCSSDGIYWTDFGRSGPKIMNNIIDSPGGYGINAAVATALLLSYGNVIYNATSGESNNITGLGTVNTTDPDFVSATDLTPQADLAGVGEPLVTNGTASYRWPGAIQPASSGGGATRLINGGLIS